MTASFFTSAPLHQLSKGYLTCWPQHAFLEEAFGIQAKTIALLVVLNFSVRVGSIWDVFWVHPCHFALHAASSVGPLSHITILDVVCTILGRLTFGYSQPHATGCRCHPTSLPIHAQGVLLPSSFVAFPGVLPPPPLLLRVCRCHPHSLHQGDVAVIPIQSFTGCVTATLPCTRVHTIAVVQFTTKDFRHLHHYEIMNYKVTKLFMGYNIELVGLACALLTSY